jgi:hypothetical protein
MLLRTMEDFQTCMATYIYNGPEGILVGCLMEGTTLQSSSESVSWSWRLMASLW